MNKKLSHYQKLKAARVEKHLSDMYDAPEYKPMRPKYLAYIIPIICKNWRMLNEAR